MAGHAATSERHLSRLSGSQEGQRTTPLPGRELECTYRICARGGFAAAPWVTAFAYICKSALINTTSDHVTTAHARFYLHITSVSGMANT